MILIDAANIEYSAKDLNARIRYKNLFQYFKKETTLISVNFYTARFGSKSHDRFLTFLKKHSFRLATKPLKLIQDHDKGELRKANFDVEITADAVNVVDTFDTLVLFSGDSDFDYLVKLLKSKSKFVLVISSRYHVSRELIASATRYIDLKKFKSIFLE